MAKHLLKWRNRPLKVLQMTDKRLHRVAKEVDFSETTEQDLIDIFRKMSNSLTRQRWGEFLGMTAPQIGINKRVMMIAGVPIINPEWRGAKQIEPMVEGCYSLPRGELYQLNRDKYGWATFYTLKGEKKQYKMNGINAIVFQHCLGHLNGICCDSIGTKVEKKEDNQPK